MTTPTKKCLKCETLKRVLKYRITNNTPDGYSSLCKECEMFWNAVAMKAIQAVRITEQPKGVITCPKCGGVINFRMAVGYNNHTGGECATEGCLQWQE